MNVTTAVSDTTQDRAATFNKVAAVTFVFWVVKICATTVGETGGDAFSMSMHLGYAVSTYIFLAIFIVAVTAQVMSKRYHPFYYWGVVVATTTVGTTTSDFLDRTAGLGYVKSSVLELAVVIAVLLVWRFTTGSIAVDHIFSRENEAFYWVTILVANTLGTALGDFVATTTGLGFEGGAIFFAVLLALVAAGYLTRSVSTSVLFWTAYVLTRPLGATLGDLLTKAPADGGLGLERFASSLAIATVMVLVIVLTSQHARIQQLAANVGTYSAAPVPSWHDVALNFSEADLPGIDLDDGLAHKWLTMLRDGTHEQMIEARHSLAAIFQHHGMVAEAITMLERNIQAGVRDSHVYVWLARLYHRRSNEIVDMLRAYDAPDLEPSIVDRGAQPNPSV